MDLEKTIRSLKKRGYEVSFFKTAEEAARYLDQKIDHKTVGFGDSESLASLGMYERLLMHNTVFDPRHPAPDGDFRSTARLCLTTDIFLLSVNGIAETGEMVNIDGTGNRIAGSLFGHEKVYFVIGTNKIVLTLEDAVWRARNIAAPLNEARHGYKAPCSILQDRCHDCSSPDRICCGQMIYYWKMRFMDMEVILVEEDLGL